MTRAFYGIALGILLLLTGVSVLSAQAPGAGAGQETNGFTNLQVWPKDTPRPVILNFMNAFIARSALNAATATFSGTASSILHRTTNARSVSRAT